MGISPNPPCHRRVKRYPPSNFTPDDSRYFRFGGGGNPPLPEGFPLLWLLFLRALFFATLPCDNDFFRFVLDFFEVPRPLLDAILFLWSRRTVISSTTILVDDSFSESGRLVPWECDLAAAEIPCRAYRASQYVREASFQEVSVHCAHSYSLPV